VTRRARDPQSYGLLVIVLVIAVAVCAVAGVAWLGRWLTGGVQEVWPGNPAALVTDLVMGKLAWPEHTGMAAIAVGVLLGLLAAGIGWLVARRHRGRSRVDDAARHLAGPGDLKPLLSGAGARVGRLIPGGQWLRRPRQWVAIQLWGPRMGKSTTQSIPAVIDADGPVLATSNKRDLLDATREPRAGKGLVWVVDPNGIAGETPGFWWNPLSYVTGVTRARQLARIFVSAQRQPGESTDSYFDKAGPALIANLLLAAAVDGRPVTDLGDWLTRQTDRTPVQILRGKGFPSQGAEVEAVIDLHPKQRGGVFGTAQETMSFLTDPALAAWITPQAGAFDVQFDPDAFVRSHDTLYLLSKEGEGSAGPIITALTAAVCEAAVSYARTCPGGRLPVPLRVELDEAANICRWGDLPDLYSHFGSQWIEVTTYLQSYAQGEGVWGREGMRKLWSASNLRVIGPGVGEVGFLSDVSKLVGDVEQNRMSTGYGHAGRNVNYSTEWRPILPVNDLGALPGPTEDGDFTRARMLVLAAGLLPALVRPVPWWETEHADAVRASIALHEPGPVPARMPAPPLPVEVRDVPRAGESGPWRKTADPGRNPYA
jgi:hypothetical protein